MNQEMIDKMDALKWRIGKKDREIIDIAGRQCVRLILNKPRMGDAEAGKLAQAFIEQRKPGCASIKDVILATAEAERVVENFPRKKCFLKATVKVFKDNFKA